uniref:Coiled-coil domain containing 33 n=1 Tax=Bubo bubo TaxID=30461 RepID=A0A8C0EQR9_BUBBB
MLWDLPIMFLSMGQLIHVLFSSSGSARGKMLSGISQKEAAKLEDPVKTSSSSWDLGLLLRQGWDTLHRCPDQLGPQSSRPGTHPSSSKVETWPPSSLKTPPWQSNIIRTKPGTDLKTTSGAIPTVGLCLQLLRLERPTAFLTPSGSNALPSLDPTTTDTLQRGEELQAAPLHPFYCQLHHDDVSLPAADAVASILPRKQPFPRGTGAPSEERRSQEIIGDNQELEVSSYRQAMKRMAGDLLSLRQHVTSLEVENGHLRRSLASQEELGHALLTDVDLDVMTQEELLDRLATLKRKLVASTAEMRRLKNRVQQLQNELIQKNDREKDLVLLQRAHRQQQATLRRCQEKVAKTKGLEETVRQQEKVIETMERVLQEKLTSVGRSTEKTAGEALSREVYTTLLAEDCRLREVLARPPLSLPPITPRPPVLPTVFGGAEKLSLLARLEEAQARKRVLERQVGITPSTPLDGGEHGVLGRGGGTSGPHTLEKASLVWVCPSWRRQQGGGDERSRSSALVCWSGSVASPTPPPRTCR